MAAWCDRTFGTDLEDRIDSQLIKWCAAFCDEGEAAWANARPREYIFPCLEGRCAV